jgi:hypothetical protein
MPVVYDSLISQSVWDAADKMVEMANQLNDTVTHEFNGLILTANPGDKPEQVAGWFIDEMKRQSDESRHKRRARYKAEQAVLKTARTWVAAYREMPDSLTRKGWADRAVQERDARQALHDAVIALALLDEKGGE